MVSNKNRYLSLVLVILSACSASDDAGKVSWLESIKHEVQPLMAWFDKKNDDSVADNTHKKSDKVSGDANLQAQTQLIGVMENMAAAPPKSEASTGQDKAQKHQDYDNAITVDEKRDALVGLIEVDASNAAILLRDAYADPELEVRKEAVLQMHAFNDQAAVVDLLLKALGDPESSVVIEAVEGLAQLSDKRAIDGLQKVAASHPDEQVRAVAQDYLDQSEPVDQLESVDKAEPVDK